ncbi:protein of unassigned function [Methylobacterium oryzae CBMB20]|uniref:Protein of unassigned function n=1 Tax=Methylobacterium oryzae CBMB20 TaxID=693986 RepID=A0A089QCC8_9HYPH|nr:protein of unassigned function [Methylobacterium oryzae CBMB20]
MRPVWRRRSGDQSGLSRAGGQGRICQLTFTDAAGPPG